MLGFLNSSFAAGGTGANAFTGNAVDDETVSIGGQVYKFQSAIGAATAATGTLSVADTPHDNETVVIGAKTYRWRSTLGAGVKAA